MIVGLTGRMRSGKNTAAERLARLSPLPVVEVSFAKKLKESAAAVLGCSIADLERLKNDENAKLGIWEPGGWGFQHEQTIRSFLQRYGTEAHRDVFGEDFWLDAALRLPAHAGESHMYDHALYVVTDVRFPNEAQRVRDLGGVVVKLYGPPESIATHPSEQDLPADWTISNTIRTDSFAALDAALTNLLTELGLDARAAA